MAGKPSEDRKRMRNRENGRSRQEKGTALDMTLIWIAFYISAAYIYLPHIYIPAYSPGIVRVRSFQLVRILGLYTKFFKMWVVYTFRNRY